MTRFACLAAALALACAPALLLPIDQYRLVSIDGRSDLRGAGDEPATLQFDPVTTRAAGFAGCNRYGGAYQQDDERLSFGPMMATKMACAEGMELESEYLDALGKVTRWKIDDSGLTLETHDGRTLFFVTP